MKYESETGAGRAIERAVKHLDSLEKVCKNDANSIVDMDDSIVVKMPHMISFNDSLIVIQMFQNIRSAACNGGSITFDGEAEKYVDVIYNILSEYARALALAENEGVSEVVPDDVDAKECSESLLMDSVREATINMINTKYSESSHNVDKEIYKVFGKDTVDKAASMDDFIIELSNRLGLGKESSYDIMSNLSDNSVLAFNDDSAMKKAKYIVESGNIVGYLVVVLDIKAYDKVIGNLGGSWAYCVGADGGSEIACVYISENPRKEETDEGPANLIFGFDIVKNCEGEACYNQYIKDCYFMLCNDERDELGNRKDCSILRIIKIGNCMFGNRYEISYDIYAPGHGLL